jgi:hypothetical protein
MVAITLSDDTEEMKTRGVIFSQVVESVRVQPAQSPVRNGDQPST